MSPAVSEKMKFVSLGLLYILSFAVVLVILFTDKNLQTDFGSVKPYFYHWYGLLAVGIISLIAGAILLFTSSRKLGIVGTVGSGLLVLFLIADVATYKTVGFKYPSEFATYLFGLSKYPGSLTYIPGLYDVLLALYLIGLIVGIVVLIRKG
ncbi:MAG: hypothetical protein QXS75_00900 [Thermoplasmatales archaeon]